MKILSIQEAQAKLAAVCEEVLAGQETRLRLANGALIQLTPLPSIPAPAALSDAELEECYNDADWAQFENHCAKAND